MSPSRKVCSIMYNVPHSFLWVGYSTSCWQGKVARWRFFHAIWNRLVNSYDIKEIRLEFKRRKDLP